LPFQSFLRFYSKCIPAERVFERMPSFQSFLRFYKKRINCGELVIENLFQSFLRFYSGSVSSSLEGSLSISVSILLEILHWYRR